MLRVATGRHDATRLVEEQIATTWRPPPHPTAIDTHVISLRVGPCAELRRDLAINGDPAFFHQPLRRAPRRDTSRGQDLLQPNASGWR
jgi:hypothetical protein